MGRHNPDRGAAVPDQGGGVPRRGAGVPHRGSGVPHRGAVAGSASRPVGTRSVRGLERRDVEGPVGPQGQRGDRQDGIEVHRPVDVGELLVEPVGRLVDDP
jgi:hypothetical protein